MMEEEEHIDNDIVVPVKKRRRELYKPPTNEEYRDLRNTNMLFHSNLVRFQITEILKEISVHEKQILKTDHFCKNLEDEIMEVPATESTPLCDVDCLKSSVQCPIKMSPKNANAVFKYSPPENIEKIGSYSLDMALKQHLNVDLLLVMPKECIQGKKDHFNHRYARKRALYLSHIAYHLTRRDVSRKVEFSYFQEDPLKPIIVITPSGAGRMFSIRIHACPSENIIKSTRFSATTNNVRHKWFNGKSSEELDESHDKKGKIHPPTPHYNMTMLADLKMQYHFDFIKKTLGDHSSYKDAIKLLKTWLKQRELDQGYGCFSGFIMTMLVAKLLTCAKINRTMSSYQIVRNVFDYLKSTDWKTEGCTFQSLVALEDFHKSFEIVFIDPSGHLNLCANMSSILYDQVRHEAEISLEFLNNTQIGFNAVFMESVPFEQKFDRLLHFPKPSTLCKTCEKKHLQGRVVDHAGNCIVSALPLMTSIIEKGLGNRLKLLAVKPHRYKTWPITKAPPSWEDIDGPLCFGLLLDSDNCNNVLHMGPAADSPEAPVFRAFWGNLSELRRFKDSSICEAVVWECDNIAEQRNIVDRTIKHLLERHCDIPPSASIMTSIDSLLSFPLKRLPGGTSVGHVGTGDEVHQDAVKASNELFQELRSLSSLPLSITNIQGVSPVLRYTEVFPSYSIAKISDRLPVLPLYEQEAQVPVPDQACPPFVNAIQVICHLEGSSKWPQDINALRRLKSAFHIAICDELKSKGRKVICYPTPNHFFVVKSGFVFRLSIGYHREITILQTHVGEDGKLKTKRTQESLALAKSSILLPHLASSLHGLYQRCQSFGDTCRLAKLWVASQLLSGHVCDEAVELICAHMFVAPAPFTHPSSSQAGFMRFLRLLATFDFASTPLIVDVREELKDESRLAIQSHFNEHRDVLPFICILTPKDRKRSVWTENGPSKIVGRRMKALAQIGLSSLTKQLNTGNKSLNLKSMFTPSLAHYDVVINLKKPWCPLLRDSVGVGKTDVSLEEACVLPVADFDPVSKYISQLKEAFDDFALFFYNHLGGPVIGVIWRPHIFDPAPLKMMELSSKSMNGDGKTLLNIPAILEDFQIFGQGLVDSINLRSDKWKI